jgi:hypothetical protein
MVLLQDSPPEPNVNHFSPTSKRWKARLVIGLIMLALAFITLLVMKIRPSAYWLFTCVMAGIDAILCVWLVWYVKRQDGSRFVGNLWHMILHWIGFIAVIYLITIFIHYGAISEVDAGIYTLIVLALTIYLAGIYTDAIFILIGVTLAIMAMGTILIKTYLLLVMIPVIVIVALIIFVMLAQERKSLT